MEHIEHIWGWIRYGTRRKEKSVAFFLSFLWGHGRAHAPFLTPPGDLGLCMGHSGQTLEEPQDIRKCSRFSEFCLLRNLLGDWDTVVYENKLCENTLIQETMYECLLCARYGAGLWGSGTWPDTIPVLDSPTCPHVNWKGVALWPCARAHSFTGGVWAGHSLTLGPSSR